MKLNDAELVALKPIYRSRGVYKVSYVESVQVNLIRDGLLQKTPHGFGWILSLTDAGRAVYEAHPNFRKDV